MINASAITFIDIFITEAIVIIIGNAFTIFVFWTQRAHLKRTCFLLISLAVADLLVGVTEPIVLATDKFEKMTSWKKRRQNDQSFCSISGPWFKCVGFLPRLNLTRTSFRRVEPSTSPGDKHSPLYLQHRYNLGSWTLRGCDFFLRNISQRSG